MNQNRLIYKHGKTGGLHKIAKMLDINQIDGFFKICNIKTVRDVGWGGECYPPPEIFYDSDSDSEMATSEISACNDSISSDRCAKCYHLTNNCVCVREVQISITGIRLNKSTQCDL